MKKNILIIYTAVGKGHKVMAENIAAPLRADYNLDMLDLFELQQSKLIECGTTVYLWVLNTIPWLWNFFYTSKIILGMTMPFRTPLAGLKSEKILKVLQSKHYDMVISTQVNPSAIMSYLVKKGLYKGKFVVSFSDYHLQRFWLFRNADMYFPNILEARDEMVRIGYDPAKIVVIGMALPKSVLSDQQQLQELRSKYGIATEDKAILIMGGTMGYKLKPELIQNLLTTGAKLFIVCGTNEKAKNEIEQQFGSNPKVKVYGYINFLPELYAITNVVVSKPGGMTVAECLQYALPVAIYSYLPGQEKINTHYLRGRNLVLPETNDIVKQVAEELHTGAFAAQLRQNSAAKVITQDSSTVKQAIDRLFHQA